jgi:hypothetical protein
MQPKAPQHRYRFDECFFHLKPACVNLDYPVFELALEGSRVIRVFPLSVASLECTPTRRNILTSLWLSNVVNNIHGITSKLLSPLVVSANRVFLRYVYDAGA